MAQEQILSNDGPNPRTRSPLFGEIARQCPIVEVFEREKEEDSQLGARILSAVSARKAKE